MLIQRVFQTMFFVCGSYNGFYILRSFIMHTYLSLNNISNGACEHGVIPPKNRRNKVRIELFAVLFMHYKTYHVFRFI